jgi:hypothetical protein
MPSPVIRLYRVLIEEYESQGLAPACPRDEFEDGVLLYIKPSLNGTEPADVFNYAKLHPAFPHSPPGCG